MRIGYMMWKLSILVLAAIVMMAIVPYPSASGYERNFKFPGSTCQPKVGDTADDFYYLYGFIMNDGSSEMEVICPFMHDIESFDYNDYDVSLWVVDQHPSYAVSCRIFAQDRDSFSRHYSSAKTSSSGFDYLALNEITGYSSRLYHVTCTIPRKYGSSSMSGVTEIAYLW